VQAVLISTLLAAGIAIAITLMIGPFMIPFLSQLKMGQNIRKEGPVRHYAKAGTPTMGGSRDKSNKFQLQGQLRLYGCWNC
jgi:phospho-N-acetylmuramoyl-pentapeptide-transferase